MITSRSTPNIAPDAPPLAVVVGVVRDAQGRILLAHRLPRKFYADYWEFPGGKQESGEDAVTALRRELAEELGIHVTQARPWRQLYYAYPERAVQLAVWEVQDYQGIPWGREGQPLAWVAPENLLNYPILPANRPLVQALRLPPFYAITPPQLAPDWPAQLTQLLTRGVRLVQWRTHLSEAQQAVAVTQALACCHAAGAQLLFNGTPAQAESWGADGVHLSAQRLRDWLALGAVRPSLAWVAASCHNAEELAQALAARVDFAVLGPVQPTATHPQVPALGWAQWTHWVQQQALPVYALGGLQRDDLPSALAAGAQGIAAIRGLWPH